MYTLSEENYLKALFHLERKSSSGVNTNALAEELETKASSVTEMLKKLSDKDLVIYRKYQGAKLSSDGKINALKVIRKHRLWELFLVEKLNFDWAEVHDLAEQLEHIKSDKLVHELERYLGYPKKDPHGDPIPDAQGNFSRESSCFLSEMKLNQSCICVGVRDSSAVFLQYLNKKHIALGTVIEIIEKEAFDQSLLITYGGKEVRISSSVANNIYVKHQ